MPRDMRLQPRLGGAHDGLVGAVRASLGAEERGGARDALRLAGRRFQPGRDTTRSLASGGTPKRSAKAWTVSFTPTARRRRRSAAARAPRRCRRRPPARRRRRAAALLPPRPQDRVEVPARPGADRLAHTPYAALDVRDGVGRHRPRPAGSMRSAAADAMRVELGRLVGERRVECAVQPRLESPCACWSHVQSCIAWLPPLSPRSAGARPTLTQWR